MPWLLEILGPQHAGKTTIADLLSLTLEENGKPALRVQDDNYLYNLFPVYAKLRATGERQKAHRLLAERWRIINDILIATTRRALKNQFTVIHDHIDTTRYRRGMAKRIAKRTHAGYLSIFVTAPLEALKERWRQSEITDVQVVQLTKTFRRFEILRRELGFNMTLDTSHLTAEEGVNQIISTIFPDLKIESATPTVKISQAPRELNGGIPQLCSGNLQILKTGDSYVIVHNHHRYITDSQGLIILSLCNGRNSLVEIGEVAGTDPDTTRKTIDFLYSSEIVTL